MGERRVACYPRPMRVIWCLAVLLGVLAPIGHVGITATPSEAESITTPRAPALAQVSRRADLAPDAAIATAPALALSTPVAAVELVLAPAPPARPSGRHAPSALRARAPPA